MLWVSLLVICFSIVVGWLEELSLLSYHLRVWDLGMVWQSGETVGCGRMKIPLHTICYYLLTTITATSASFPVRCHFIGLMFVGT